MLSMVVEDQSLARQRLFGLSYTGFSTGGGQVTGSNCSLVYTALAGKLIPV